MDISIAAGFDAPAVESKPPKTGFYPFRIVKTWPTLEDAIKDEPEGHEGIVHMVDLFKKRRSLVKAPNVSGQFHLFCQTKSGDVLALESREQICSANPWEAYLSGHNYFGVENGPYVVLWVDLGNSENPIDEPSPQQSRLH